MLNAKIFTIFDENALTACWWGISLTDMHILLFWFTFYNFLRKEKYYLPYFGVAAEGLGANGRSVNELKKLQPYLRSRLATHCNVSSSHFLLYDMLDFCKCTPYVFVLFCCLHQLSFPIPAIWILEAMNNFSLYKFNFEPNDKWVIFIFYFCILE